MRRLVPGLLAAVVLLTIFWAARTVLAGARLVRSARAAQELLTVGPRELDPDVVGSLLRDARRDTLTLKRSVGWLAPLGPRLTWLPQIGPVLGEAPVLLDLGDALTELGDLLWEAAAPAMVSYQQGASVPSLLPDLVGNVSRESATMLSLAERAGHAYAGLNVAALPYRFRDPVEQLDALLPLLKTGLEFADGAPGLLGLDRPRTYLVLALNESELRPGGGFISSVAEVRISNGDVTSMVFRDSYAVDDFTLPYPDPPDPLRRLMGLDLWVFRDSNWSPDFPIAAQQVIELYRPGYELEIDGVIGLDQRALSQLVGVLEPLNVPGEAEAVTGDTVLAYMYAAWDPGDAVLDEAWWLQRKDFVGELAGVAIEKVTSGDVDYLRLADVVVALLEERHLQIYVKDEATSRWLAAKGWDGGLPPRTGEGDFLAVVEANVGYNKASAHVSRRLRYEVDLSGSIPIGAVELRYENHNPASQPCDARVRYDARYQDMMDRCYWAYVRLYVPEDSTLDAASRHPIPPELLVSRQPWPGEAQIELIERYTVFSQAFLLPRAEVEVLTFAYTLPPTVVVSEPSGVQSYRLVIHKQAGWSELQVEVGLRLPESAVVLNADPQPRLWDDRLLTYEMVSRTDIEIVLEYQLPEG